MRKVAPRRILVLALLGSLLAGAVFSGCGDSSDDVSPPPDYAKKLAGSPAPLAALHDQSDQLLPGGLDAYNERITALKGFPIVVNVWASWCGPCRSEFPLLQQASAEMGREVAFLGVNSSDADDAATTFLSTHSVPYPSYVDPDADIADDLGVTHGFPGTAFYGADGKLNYVKHGEFHDQAELDSFIEKYAVAGQTD